MHSLPRLARGILILLLLLVHSTAAAQNFDPLDRAVQNLIAAMPPQQRVGQLVMVTFQGSYLGQDADIVRLITDYQVGGVVVMAENDNINGRANTPARVFALTSGLQRVAWQAADDSDLPYLPLLIATTHNGDGLPYTQIISGTTPLPSYMALGATWEPDYARLAGRITGEELAAMGINMLLGPSLDVAAQPTAGGVDLLGTQTFGGEPYWVGRMGAAYVEGVRQGSENRVLVVARHLPGLGASDRELSQEIPVVPRSAEELRRFDLVPFFAVTGQAAPESRVDGLQCANIRYQGENIRTETRPVCVDVNAFRTVMDMDGYGDWRQNGMILSDALGTRAIRRWYDVEPFPHRQVARDALLAGNDMLLLADFGAESGDDPFANIADTIQFFTEGYLADSVFAARVDESLRRIVRKKLELYGSDLRLENVLSNPLAHAQIGRQMARLFDVPRSAVTLIAPPASQLTLPPQVGESIVIITDTRPQQQCSYCDAQPIIAPDALESAIRALYGGAASGQVSDESISSYTLADLDASLNAPGNGLPLQEALSQADWVVFAVLDNAEEVPSVDVVQLFLEARTDLISSRTRVVVMAFGAPYYLSSTDISKLSAYYGLYGHTQPFIDAGARALFQEVPLRGALPVSLQAVNYDVFVATSPDPAQTLRLTVEKIDSDEKVQSVQVGDTLVIRTEPIVDRNGNIVPDGTPAIFTLSFVTEGVQTQQDVATVNGVAQATFVLRRTGQVEIRVASVEATTSVTFEITVGDDQRAATLQTIEPPTDTALSVVTTPTATATDTPTATATATDTATATATATDTATATATATDTATATATDTPTATATDTPTATATPTPAPLPEIDTSRSYVTVSDLLLSLAGLLFLVMPAFAAGWAASRSLDGSVRMVLGTVVAGLTGYVYYGAGAPGAALLREAMQDLAAMLVTFLAGFAGLLFTWWTVRE